MWKKSSHFVRSEVNSVSHRACSSPSTQVNVGRKVIAFLEQHDVFNFFFPLSTTLQVFRMDVVWTSFGTLQIHRE